MAVVVVAEVEGGNQEFYEKVSAKAMPDGTPPEGVLVHIAGPTDSGWRVINVWESEEHFEKFRNETLIPALQEAGEGERVDPSIKAEAVHRLITT